MVWVALAGIFLQVIGIAVAIRGFADSYKTLVGADRSLRHDLWEQELKRWMRLAWQKLRRKEPQPVTVTGRSTLPAMESAAAGFVVSQPEDPGMEAPADQRLDYVHEFVNVLSEAMETNRTQMETKVDETRERLIGQINHVASQVQETRQMVTTFEEATFGRDGKGLRETVLGLVIAAVGILMTIAGLSFS